MDNGATVKDGRLAVDEVSKFAEVVKLQAPRPIRFNTPIEWAARGNKRPGGHQCLHVLWIEADLG